MAKRLLDLFGAMVGLVLFFPLLAFIAAWIKLDSAGPIFFRQERVGRYGQSFWIHKFRTMVVDAESRGLQLTTQNDSRITRSGAFLRKYKLDELAQLLDVLYGDMSLVGPRPEVQKYVAHYPPELKEIALSVKPGITDFASIEYRDENKILANAPDAEDAYIRQVLPVKLKYHKKYATEQSLLLDLFLIFKTSILVFGRWFPDTLNSLDSLSHDQKRLGLLALDAIVLPLAYWSALVLVEETFTPKLHHILWMIPVIILVTVPIFIHLGLYRAVIRHMEDRSAYVIFAGVTLSVLLLIAVSVSMKQLAYMHKGVFIIYWLVALVYIGGSRILLRSYYRRKRHPNELKKQVIIYGAGERGVHLAMGMLAAGRKIPIAFVDDDPLLQHREIAGITVYSPDELPRLIDDMQIENIFVSVASVSSEKREELLSSLKKLHKHVYMIPGLDEIMESADEL